MKILVTGVTGQLGYDVAREAERRGHEVIGVGRSADAYCRNYIKCDITNESEIFDVIAVVKPDAIIHCAAWTDVNGAEENWNECIRVNYTATIYIARAAAFIGAKMLYVSTDYVFGVKFDEEANPIPADIYPHYTDAVNTYGMSKAMGENAVREIIKEHFIVRISWVFGINGKNFVKTMLNLAEKHGDPVVVNDQFGRPTYTVDVARLMVDMVETDKYGTYNATNEGNYTTWFGFAQKIYEISGKFWMTVKPKMTENDGFSVAKRQKNSMLDTNKLRLAGFEPLPSWEDACRRYLEEINEI